MNTRHKLLFIFMMLIVTRPGVFPGLMAQEIISPAMNVNSYSSLQDTIPPLPVTILTLVEADKNITLTWKSNIEADLSHYLVYRNRANDPVNSNLIGTVAAPDTFYSDTDVLNNILYYYWIIAVDSANNKSDYSSVVEGMPVDLTPPASPVNFVAKGTDRKIILQWSANTEHDLSHYRIYRAFDEDSLEASIIDSVTHTETLYIDEKVKNDSIYYYWLSAVDSAKNESIWSDGASAIPIDTIPPLAPVNFTAYPANREIKLSWTPNTEDDLSGYKLYRNIIRDSLNAIVIDSLVRTDTAFTDIQVENYTNYYYWLSAFDSSGNMSIQSQFSAGTPNAFIRMNNMSIVADSCGFGASSWADYDNDGDLDLFITNSYLNNNNNFLFSNMGDGTFQKITEGYVISDGAGSVNCSWADFNNDNNLDLFVCNYLEETDLYVNEGIHNFHPIRDTAIVSNIGETYGCSWGDCNNDGFVELLVTDNPGAGNFLYMNNGDNTFRQIISGPVANDVDFTYGCNWIDYDNDGDQDIYLVNRGNKNVLYANDGNGVFQTVIEGDIVNEPGFSSGSSWGDYDNDGDMDAFVTNQSNPFSDVSNNYLYSNNGDGTFTKITTGDIVNDAGHSFGSCWCDFNNDGYLDLFVANADLPYYDGSNNNSLYMNNGDSTFTKIKFCPIVTDGGNSWSSICGDYDNDGDMDLFVTNQVDRNFFYKNMESDNNWIILKCKGIISNAAAIGAKVRTKAAIKQQKIWQMREISAQTGFCCQNSLDVHFGLGDAAIVDSIIIEWPSGIKQYLESIPVNQIYTIYEDTASVSSIDGNQANIPGDYVLGQNYPNPFNPVTIIDFSVKSACKVELYVYDILGRKVRALIDENYPAGYYKIRFNGSDLPTGLYFYHIKMGSFTAIKKALLLK